MNIDLRLRDTHTGSRKGHLLNEQDVFTLQLILHFKEITTQQLYPMIHFNLDGPKDELESISKPIKYRSFLKKLQKWESSSGVFPLIKTRYLYKGSKIGNIKVLKLSKWGFEVLKNFNLIPTKHEISFNKISNFKRHYAIVKATSALIQLIESNKDQKVYLGEDHYYYKGLGKEGLMFSGWEHNGNIIETKQSVQLYSINPSYFNYEEGQLNLYPDWVLKTGREVINLEINIGTESHKKLQEKVISYQKLLRGNVIHRELNHYLLFVVLGEYNANYSLEQQTSYICNVRIRNMKRELARLDIDNIPLYVIKFSRISSFGELFYFKKGTFVDKGEKTTKLKSYFKTFRFLTNDPRTFTFDLFEEKKNIEKVLGENSADLLLFDQENVVNIIYHMEEGNVADFKRLSYVNDLLHQNKLENVKVLVVYSTLDSMLEDVVPNNLHKEVYFTNGEDFENDRIYFYDCDRHQRKRYEI